MAVEEERVVVQPCGCRHDWPTGLALARCAGHDARRLVEEARRALGELASRDRDAAYAHGLLRLALEAMGR